MLTVLTLRQKLEEMLHNHELLYRQFEDFRVILKCPAEPTLLPHLRVWAKLDQTPNHLVPQLESGKKMSQALEGVLRGLGAKVSAVWETRPREDSLAIVRCLHLGEAAKDLKVEEDLVLFSYTNELATH